MGKGNLNSIENKKIQRRPWDVRDGGRRNLVSLVSTQGGKNSISDIL